MTRALTDGSADSSIEVGKHRVYGLPVDAETRCVHWAGRTDVVAIAFHCCGRLFPCHACHDAVADHPAERWPRDERDTRAILCGVCTTLLPIADYLLVDACPLCNAPFNPACRFHNPLYFA